MAKDNNYTQIERDKVSKYWNDQKNAGIIPSLVEIVKFFSDNVEGDPRSKVGHKVRKILSDLQIKAKTQVHVKVDGIELNDSQKEFINNNIKDNRSIDICRILWPGQKIAPLGREVRAVTNYLKEIGAYVGNIKKGEGTFPEGKYEPPRTFHNILAKVNEYLHEELSTQNITAFEKKCLETTIQFLHSPRFVSEINNYNTVEKRKSFESEFIRAVYGKIDLQPEEVSLTINFCNDVLQAADLRKLLEQLHDKLNTISEDENGKYSQSLAVSIGEVTTNLNEILKRQERVYSLLNKSRAKRDEEKTNRTANLAQLFEWFRDEENRKKAVKQAELLRLNRRDEVKREETLSDTILLCLGMSAESI